MIGAGEIELWTDAVEKALLIIEGCEQSREVASKEENESLRRLSIVIRIPFACDCCFLEVLGINLYNAPAFGSSTLFSLA